MALQVKLLCDAIGDVRVETKDLVALGAKCKDINGRTQMGFTPLCQAVQVVVLACMGLGDGM